MCNYCEAAKRLLTRNNATYTEIDIAKVEGAMRFTKVNIKRHSEKTSAFTTSRLPYFMEIVAESVFESTSADASWHCIIL